MASKIPASSDLADQIPSSRDRPNHRESLETQNEARAEPLRARLDLKLPSSNPASKREILHALRPLLKLAFVRANTTDKFGPSRVVRSEQVFEIAFEDVQRSTRHKAGLSVVFPRIKCWRRDKKAGEADFLEKLRALLAEGA